LRPSVHPNCDTTTSAYSARPESGKVPSVGGRLERRPAVIALNDCWPSLPSEGGRFLVPGFEAPSRDARDTRDGMILCQAGRPVESMKLPRRQFLQLAAGAAALPAVSRIARAQGYPARPVHWIVSFAAGGPNDIVARIVGQYLSDHLGQQFIIENRPGAGGNVGMQSVLSAAPDGYTIAFVGPNYAINPTLYEKLPF